MSVEECEFPCASQLDRRWVEAAYFSDSYRVPLLDTRATVCEIFFAIFGHHPAWMKRVLMARNAIARWCGLDAPTASELVNIEARSRYSVGDKIGVWPIFALSETELVAGRDNKHLDFRLSVVKEADGGHGSVVVSTVCRVNNVFGRIYLLLIIPFHRWGMQILLARAMAAGRL
ncbi:MAG: hypothetical protein JWP43_1551 [Ramlibacter sp.]|nr:hypothetical protein [Ramlibacter sp.]